MNYITFPWEQLGGLLRRMSLAGELGNAAAWACYLTVGAVPLAVWVFLLFRGRAVKIDALLSVLSAVIYVGVWFFVNPSYIDVYLSPAYMGGFAKYTLGLVLWGVFFSWLLLRFLTGYEKWGRARLLRALEIILGVYGVLRLASFFLQGEELSAALRTLEENNTGASDLGLSRFFLVLQTVTDKLPQMLELALFVMAIGFLHGCERENFSAEGLRWVEKLKRYSALFVAVVLIANVGVNVLQLLFARRIYSSSYNVVLPLREVMVMLGILILSRFYLESRRIKEDNDMII